MRGEGSQRPSFGICEAYRIYDFLNRSRFNMRSVLLGFRERVVSFRLVALANLERDNDLLKREADGARTENEELYRRAAEMRRRQTEMEELLAEWRRRRDEAEKSLWEKVPAAPRAAPLYACSSPLCSVLMFSIFMCSFFSFPFF